MDVMYNVMLQSEKLNALSCINKHCHQSYHQPQFWNDKVQLPIDVGKTYTKVLKLLQTVVEDEDFDEKAFIFCVEDDVYDGPNLGLYGGAQESYEEAYYDQYDDRFDTSSCIDLFPTLHEEFKLKITSLMNCYLIQHHVTVKLLDRCVIEYQIYNLSDNCLPCIHMSLSLTYKDFIAILVQLYTRYPKLCVTDVEGMGYKGF